MAAEFPIRVHTDGDWPSSSGFWLEWGVPEARASLHLAVKTLPCCSSASLPISLFLWCSGPLLGLGQPATAQVFGWNRGKIGLEVENRSSVQHVNSAYVQTRPSLAQELHHGQANWIRPARRAGGEYTMGPVVAGRGSHQLVAFGAIENPHHEEM